MIIRVDKCVTFGMKKVRTKSVQYQPKLLINSQLVPCVSTGSSFKYLGRYFDIQMSNYKHKSQLIDTTNTILAQIDHLPLHPKYKILLYSRHLLSKISWHFTEAGLQKHGCLKILLILLHRMFENGWKFQYVEHSAMSFLLKQSLV